MVIIPFVSNVLLMPIIGYGTWQSSGDDLTAGVEEALKNGYRHFDCAAFYDNENLIGDVFQKWLKAGKVKREELFIASKLPPVGMRPSSVSKYLDKTLKDLQLDYIDLYLIHTPFGLVDGEGLLPMNSDGTVKLDTTTDHIAIWKEMERQVQNGKVRAIGLANFNETQIQRVLDNCTIKPANIQIEMHLYNQQKDMRKFCAEKGIPITAYSPLGSRGSKILFTQLGDTREIPDLFKQPAVKKLAEKYNKSSGQILLRHLVQKGVAVIPKSTSPAHIKENIDILDFELTPEEISELDSLDQGSAGRILDFKMFRGVPKHPEYPFNPFATKPLPSSK